MIDKILGLIFLSHLQSFGLVNSPAALCSDTQWCHASDTCNMWGPTLVIMGGARVNMGDEMNVITCGQTATGDQMNFTLTCAEKSEIQKQCVKSSMSPLYMSGLARVCIWVVTKLCRQLITCIVYFLSCVSWLHSECVVTGFTNSISMKILLQ